MATHQLTLRLLTESLAVCRLPPQAPTPGWANAGPLCSITRSTDELSIVCAASSVPAGVECERPWRALAVEGPLDFSLTGVLLSLAAPLAEAEISIFALSTFDTDYVLVRELDLDRAVLTLQAAGHTVATAATR